MATKRGTDSGFDYACTRLGTQSDGARVGVVNIDGRREAFACQVEAQTDRLATLNRHLSDLTGERNRVAIELRHLRGWRAYAEITANNNRLDEVDK